MRAFGRYDPIIPEVAFPTSLSPINGLQDIARPGFRLWILCFSESSQASFCPYTLLRISDPDELTFGRR